MAWLQRKVPDSAPGVYQQALDVFPRPAWFRDEKLNLTWVNQAYVNASGADRETILSAQKELLRHTTDPDGRTLARQAAETQKPTSAPRHLIVQGARRLFLATEQPIPGGLFGFALDQTQTEELQSELMRTRGAEAQVLKNLATAVAIFGADQKLNFYNPSFAAMTDLPPGVIDSSPTMAQVMNTMRERGRLPEYPDFRKTRETWQAWFTNLIDPHEELLHLMDSTTLHLRVLPHPAGGLMWTIENITDRLALEAAYNTQNAVQRATLDNLSEGTVLLGGDGRVQLWNPIFLDIWELDEAKLPARIHWAKLVEYCAEQFNPAAWESVQESFANAPLSHMAVAETYELKDGRVIEFAAQPLPDGAMLLRFMDATDKARLTAALQDRADALAAADRLKSEFLYNVSYQLRTPLNAIMGFTELLRLPVTGALTDRQTTYTRDILDAADSLVMLIDNLLALSSIQAGQVEIERQPTAVYELLLEVKSFSETLAKAAELNVRVDANDTLGIVPLDAARMKQVLLNLVSNAVKFTPPGGAITLGARRENKDNTDGILFWVRDEGPGIAAKDQQRIFQPFERTQQKGAGAGLGLSLVKSLVQLHGGEVTLVSQEGDGTEVRCWIPA
jgi:signal transduction histidine kinase